MSSIHKVLKQRGQVKFLHKLVFISSLSSELQPAQQKWWWPITLISNTCFSAAQFLRWWQNTFLNKKKRNPTNRKKNPKTCQLFQFNIAYQKEKKTNFFLFLPCRNHHFMIKDFLLKENKIKQRIYLMIHCLSFSPSCKEQN